MTDNNLYSYQPKGNHLTIFKGVKKVHTPKGNLVFTEKEPLAKRIIAELEQGKEVSDTSSVLCFHYTFCDLVKDYDAEAVRSDLNEWCQYNIEDDLFLGLDGAESELLLQELSDFFRQCNMHQLVAIIVMLTAFDSVMIAKHVVHALAAKEGDDYDAAKAEFLAKLKTFCQENELDYSSKFGNIIDAFTYYYNIDD